MNSRVIAGNQLIMLLRFMAKQKFWTATSTKFPLVSMRGQVTVFTCVDLGSEDPNRRKRNYEQFRQIKCFYNIFYILYFTLFVTTLFPHCSLMYPPFQPPCLSTGPSSFSSSSKLAAGSGLMFLGQELHHDGVRGFLSAIPCLVLVSLQD